MVRTDTAAVGSLRHNALELTCNNDFNPVIQANTSFEQLEQHPKPQILKFLLCPICR